MNRRHFLGVSTAAGASYVLGGCALSPRRRVSPNGKISHACIGVGGLMGGGDLESFRSHPKLEITAICDVDRAHLEKAATIVPAARRYSDWREMLAKEGDRIDSLNVTVPDHMHAPIALSAVRAGKHVYCQKPLCHDVAECRALAEAARSSGLVTQLGTQFAAGVGDRMAVQLLRSRAIGPVHRVVLCSNRPNAVANYRLAGPRPSLGEAAPAGLEWDLWLGTAPERPYAARLYHPAKWRSWQDFGTGWSGDIGCHLFDAVWKGLGLTAPRSVTARVQESWRQDPARRADTWPQSNHITWVFPPSASTGGRDLTVEWFDGEFFPPEEIQAIARAGGFTRYPAEAAMVIGAEGSLLLPHQSGPVLLPKERFEATARPRLQPRSHFHHFVDACFGGEMVESHFLQTAPMTEAILLGTVAVRMPGTVLQWDASNMTVTNVPKAGVYLRRDYRNGWKVGGF
ncbi:MAG: Gfo/Idh/MocA family oxidoreductase [Opitutaceae bacterium]|nr:Gfo/Idh/MocA family oxidoreductase [Opitutaceae bacterium]